MPKSTRRGVGRLIAATGFSMAGFRAAWRAEEAFRQEVLLVMILAPIALWLGQTFLQRALLIASCLLVLIVELLNSAIESVVDRIGHDLHELSGRAKDMGSAAVLLSLVLVAVVWGAIAWERLYGT
jgi:diacylglycerol kinase (ATP)